MKRYIRLDPKKTKSTLVSQFRTIAPDHGNITLGSAGLEEVKSVRILGVTLDFKLTFETQLREDVSKGRSRAPSRKVI